MSTAAASQTRGRGAGLVFARRSRNRPGLWDARGLRRRRLAGRRVRLGGKHHHGFLYREQGFANPLVRLAQRLLGGEDFQTNLIMPEPTIFLDRKFSVCSIIRPTNTQGAAMGAAKTLTADGLFLGQTPAFFAALTQLAKEADAAKPGA